MWRNVATRGHVQTLHDRGWIIVEPEAGHLASGATGFSNTQPYSWTLATFTGTASLSGTPTFVPTANLSPSNGVFALAISNGTVYLNFSPVPEPAAVLIVCVAGAGAAGWARRWRRQHSTA